ncbi:MAG: FkbM family methyltransferase [Patescibacteria group bacterium]
MYIKIQSLVKKHCIKINGVVHLGAHQAEEAPDYQEVGVPKVIWVEGNPELIPTLEKKLKEYPNQFVYNILVSDSDNQKINFNIMNNLQSSSILELGTHKKHHPSVKVHHTLPLKTHRLDTFFTNNNIDISDCNFLNIDIQGAELLAIKGLGDYLQHFDYIYTEINIGKVYKNCPVLFELDTYLHQHGFIRAETYLTPWQWGDAFYIKQNSTFLQKKWNLFYALCLQYLYPFKKNIIIKLYRFCRKILGKIKRLFFKKNIIIKIRGGLGNQMFQYAFGKSIATQSNSSLILDLSNYKSSVRTFLIDKFNINYDFTFSSTSLSRIIFSIFKSRVYTDNSSWGEVSEIIERKNIFSGNWESPKHFANIDELIKKEFTLKNSSNQFKKMSGQIQKNSISVHVRRGDYLIPHGKYLNGIEYYDSAVKKILEIKNIESPQITIFSDDKDWCRREMSVLSGIKTEIFDVPEIDDVEELMLMSQYNHNVISNSTFSWWSTHLNKNRDKIIVGPKNWFTDKERNRKQIEDIMLESWVLI